MKSFLTTLFSLTLLLTTACANKNFTANSPNLSEDANNADNTVTEDINVHITPIEDLPPTLPTGEACPRYDLIVDSTRNASVSLNYKFTYNAEMKQNSTQGNINLQFLADSSTVHYTQCSGAYVNTMISPNFNPLDATESLSENIVISIGKTCTTPSRVTTLRVIDSANGHVLYDEQKMRQDAGGCSFGYSEAGRALRSQIIALADGVAQAKAITCNK